jgi:predicted ester cyclase
LALASVIAFVNTNTFDSKTNELTLAGRRQPRELSEDVCGIASLRWFFIVLPPAYKIVRSSRIIRRELPSNVILLQERTVATKLTLDQMKKFVRDHFEDFVNKRNAAVIRKNMTPDFYDHDGPGGKPTGVDGDERMMIAMYNSMPDLRLTIEDMIAEGDKVMCRNIWRWTDNASSQKMQFHGFVLWRFEGDKIAERWATVTAPVKETS